MSNREDIDVACVTLGNLVMLCVNDTPFVFFAGATAEDFEGISQQLQAMDWGMV